MSAAIPQGWLPCPTPNCNAYNPQSARVCGKCHNPITQKSAQSLERVFDEDAEDISSGVMAVKMECERVPGFVPGFSFLQRRLRWGYARASRLLPEILRRIENETTADEPNRSTVPNADHPELFEPEERARSEEGNASASGPELERRASASTVGSPKKKGRDTRRFLVRVTSIRRRLIDEDNLCEKYVVDCCRYAGLLPGDGPGQTRIEVTQRKAGKEEPESTMIEIYELPSAHHCELHSKLARVEGEEI